MTAWQDCTGFQRDLLVGIAAITGRGDLPYGLAIRDELQAHYDELNHSRLYQNLDRLETEGLVERSAVDARTNAYRLTDAGEDALRGHAEQLVAVLGDERGREPAVTGGPQ